MDFTINTALKDKITQSRGNLNPVKHIQLTLTSARLDISDANAYGSILLGYLPDRNFVFLGGEFNLSCVKDGTGILSTEQPKVAVGTAAASNATLSSTMSDMINGGSTGGLELAATLTAAADAHSHDNASGFTILYIGDGATTGIYLNSSVNPTGDGYMLITGTIDLYFLDTGNTTS